MTFHPYEPYVAPCSGKAMPGTKNLATALNDLFDRSTSLGVYNCRPPSTHSDGRAFDMGFPVVDGKAHAQGFEALAVLRAKAWELGLTELIFDRKRYTAKNPAGVPYTGVSSHIDHIHMGQAQAYANTLTLDQAYQHLEGDSMLTPEEQATLNELVQIRRNLLAKGSSLSVVEVGREVVLAFRKLDDVFDAIEI